MNKKNILIVYPHDFYERNSGINTRYYELISYFSSRNFCIDIFALKNFESSWKDLSNYSGEMVNQLFLCDFAKSYQKKDNESKLTKFINYFNKNNCNKDIQYHELPDFTFIDMKKQFNEIISKKYYDIILISYLYWANLVKTDLIKKSDVILEISDFLTCNLFDSCDGKIKIGNLLEEEIKRASLFKKIICISEDEKFFFSQFIPSAKFFYIPFFMAGNHVLKKSAAEFDIMFIGSDNPHNKKGIKWFFESVYPLLENSLKILVVGKISEYIGTYDNVTTNYFIEDLKDVYSKSKILVCPLLGGTGMKIKIVEALSFGIPVVTTSKGVIGLPSKINNGCLVSDEPEGFAKLIKRLLNDNIFYDRQCEIAHKYFLDNFEKTKVYEILDRIFQ